MAVRIRLTRVGATKQPTYRFVVAESRNARDGRSLDTIGFYNPRSNPIEIKVDEDKAHRWMSRGAKPSDTVARLFRHVGVLPEASGPAKTTKSAPKSKAQQAQAAKAAAAAAKAAAAAAKTAAAEAKAVTPAPAAADETAPAEAATGEAASAESEAAAESAETAEAETAESAPAEEE